MLQVAGDPAQHAVVRVKQQQIAFAFVQRLETGGMLREARLSAYELRQDGPQQGVRFTAQARWEAIR